MDADLNFGQIRIGGGGQGSGGGLDDFHLPNPGKLVTDILQRRFDPDTDGWCPPIFEKTSQYFEDLVKRLVRGGIFGNAKPREWNSVHLMYNLVTARQTGLGDYAETNGSLANQWMENGTDNADVSIDEFFKNYFNALSYGHFRFGVATPKDAAGNIIIPTIDAPNTDVGKLVNAFLDANGTEMWVAAGSLLDGRMRLIPSVVLIHNYSWPANAGFSGWEYETGGHKYKIGDWTHVKLNLGWTVLSSLSVPRTVRCRGVWGTLAHEYSHNFLEVSDMYTPCGCAGYWDILGDNSPPSLMSETCSPIKARLGWLQFKEELRGPNRSDREYTLRPYTTTGDAIKVIPDPENNPFEYFTLEFRGSTGTEPWRPDGGLTERGLFITHMNERIGLVDLWLMREAPYFDPEFADFSDRGSTLWTGCSNTNGVLYPQGSNNSFTRSTSPNSNLYGGRPSGVSITNIRIETLPDTSIVCKFRLSIAANPRVGWTMSAADKAVSGRFVSGSVVQPMEIVITNGRSIGLIGSRQAQFHVDYVQDTWVGGWPLSPNDNLYSGDFDGDGISDILIKNDTQMGLLKWRIASFTSAAMSTSRIGDWTLAANDRVLVYDMDNDRSQEIILHNGDKIGVFKFATDQFRVETIVQGSVGGTWSIQGGDKLVVGRFVPQTAPNGEIVAFRSSQLAALSYDRRDGMLQWRVRGVASGRIGDWDLSITTDIVAGDFDGDGYDELYVRAPEAAGILKFDSTSNQWRAISVVRNLVVFEGTERSGDQRLSAATTIATHAARMLPNRDCILHRDTSRVSVIALRNVLGTPSLRVITWLNNSSQWSFAQTNKFVAGDYHRRGTDIGDPSIVVITPGLDDFFIHDANGTAMVGGNPLTDRYQFGLTWHNQRVLLRRDS